MKQTSELSNKTKNELTALARRKKIPVSSGMLKEALIKAIKKGLRKIEAQKKSKTAKKISKKKSTKTSKAKTARKSTSRKTVSKKGKQTAAKKKTTRKKGPAKGKVKKAPAKKSVTRKPKTVRSPKKVKSQTLPKPVEAELPDHYGDHRLVVLPRDPNWAYAYWDLNPARVRDLLKSARQTPGKAHWILRVYSAPLHPEENKQRCFDVDTNVEGGNYYLNLSRPGARFIVELGVMDASGMFRSTAQSNPFILPLDHPADTIAPEKTFSEKVTSPTVSSFTKPPSSRSQ